MMSSAAEGSPGRAWKTVMLASLGGAFEIYDFIIYGVFAREIGPAFFPNAESALLSTYAVFAIGYVARPLGGLFLGSLGDRIGRKAVFLISILAMSCATLAIGLIPGYATIGIAAPILLVVCRMLQGVFLAGELPCSIVYVVEEKPLRAGFVSGTVIACVNTGVLVATLVSLGIHLIVPDGGYGWRVAFLVGGVLGLVSYRFRRTLQESAEFRRMKQNVSRSPLRETLRRAWRQILVGVGAASIVNTSNIFLFVVLPTYFTATLKYPPAEVSAAQNIGIAVATASIFATGWLSDRIPARYLHRAGAAILLIIAYPFYQLIGGGAVGPGLTYVVLGAINGLVGGTYAYILADLFPTRIRFTGVALTLNLSTVIFTALTPFATTLILTMTGLREAPGIVLAGVAALAIAAGFALRGLSNHIRADDPALRLGPAQPVDG